jgi:VWFA-related protein
MLSRLFVFAAATALAGQTGTVAVDPPPIQLYVTARDAGDRRLVDLGEGDFEVVQGGDRRRVEHATFVAPGTRFVAVYMDEYHVSSGASAERARDVAASLINRHLAADDLLAVVKPLDSLVGIRLTHERQTALDAIAAFEGRRGQYTPRTLFEKYFFASDPERVEAARGQIATSALGALVSHLGELGEGRKALVVVSEGFGRGPRRRDGSSSLTALTRSASRAGVAIYPIDPRALVEPAVPVDVASSPAEREARETLQALASGTGGEARLEPGSAEPLLARLVEDLGGYYKLVVRAEDGDSGFRNADVRSTRPGVAVRGPSVYWAPPPPSAPRPAATARRLPAPGLPTLPSWSALTPSRSTPRVSGLIRPWFGLGSGTGGQSTVNFVWDAAPGERESGPPAAVAMRVAAADGAVVFEGAVPPASPIAFAAAPGRLTVLMAIVDRDAQLMDVDVRAVTVRAFDAPLWMETPMVIQAQSDEGLREVAANPSAAPVSAREFSADARVLIRLRAHADAGTPSLTATMLNRDLQVGWFLTLEPGPAPGSYQVALPMATLPLGQYALELTAAQGGRHVTESVAILVRP